MLQVGHRSLLMLIVGGILLLEVGVFACEDEHPPVVRTPVVEFLLKDIEQRPVVEMAFDPRGLQSVKTADAVADTCPQKGLPIYRTLFGHVSVSLATRGLDQDINIAFLLCYAHRQSFESSLLAGNVNFERLSLPPASQDRKSTRLNSSHTDISRMPSSA